MNAWSVDGGDRDLVSVTIKCAIRRKLVDVELQRDKKTIDIQPQAITKYKWIRRDRGNTSGLESGCSSFHPCF